MNIVKFLRDLKARGVEIVADGDMLDVSAPLGVIAASDLETIKANKGEILRLLTGNTPSPDGPEKMRPAPNVSKKTAPDAGVSLTLLDAGACEKARRGICPKCSQPLRWRNEARSRAVCERCEARYVSNSGKWVTL